MDNSISVIDTEDSQSDEKTAFEKSSSQCPTPARMNGLQGSTEVTSKTLGKVVSSNPHFEEEGANWQNWKILNPNPQLKRRNMEDAESKKSYTRDHHRVPIMETMEEQTSKIW